MIFSIFLLHAAVGVWIRLSISRIFISQIELELELELVEYWPKSQMIQTPWLRGKVEARALCVVVRTSVKEEMILGEAICTWQGRSDRHKTRRQLALVLATSGRGWIYFA